MKLRIFIGIVLIVAVLLGVNYLRPVPAVAASASVPSQTMIAGTAPTLPWPIFGSAAVGVSGLGPLGTSGNEQPGPIASVAKVMTALVILSDKALTGSDGPTITITDQDVQSYQADLADNQSVVKVQAGEQLTEYQALEAMLIPSANNIAETLARWDAGSIAGFVDRMNKKAKALGFKSTKFADPSGISPNTVGTPSELMRLGMAAMKQPVFSKIVRITQTTLPVAGIVYNVNSALGQDGIVGIKTGSNLSTGATFLFAAEVLVGKFPETIYGCVMGQPTLAAAFSEAKSLIEAVLPALTVKQVLAKDQTVGAYDTPWLDHSDVLSTSNVSLLEWPGMVLRLHLDSPALSIDNPLRPGTSVGNLHILLGDYRVDVPVVTANSLYPPRRFWRLTRLPGSNS